MYILQEPEWTFLYLETIIIYFFQFWSELHTCHLQKHELYQKYVHASEIHEIFMIYKYVD